MAEATSTLFDLVEQWKAIPEFNGIYEVSNLGRARSYLTSCSYGRRTRSEPLIMQASKYRCGYIRLGFFPSPGKKVRQMLHRCVMAAFVGPCPAGHEVNHIDGDKTNNRLDNLEYVTRSENTKHAFRTGLKKRPNLVGSNHNQARIKDDDVREIRRLRECGMRYEDIGAKYKLHPVYVQQITKRRRRAEVI